MERYIWADWAWLATDAAGRVAIFTTAGVAPIPTAVLDQPGIVDPAEELVSQLPPVGRAELLVSLPRPDDFVAFAERGLFAYDWADVSRVRDRTGCYELQARPAAPISASQLGPELSAAAGLVRFAGVAFADSVLLPVGQLVACETPPNQALQQTPPPVGFLGRLRSLWRRCC